MPSATKAGIGRRRLLGLLGVGAAAALLPACAGSESEPIEQRGFALPTWERNGYRYFDTAQALHEMYALGARWVQLVPTWYQETATSNLVGPTGASVSEDDTRLAIDLAHDTGLKVMLKPHVDVLDGTDRQWIAPSDPDAWFRSYGAYVGRFVGLAQRADVEQFAVGTELSGLSGQRGRWLALIDDVRPRYGGRLVYAANYFEYQAVSFWDAVDLAGVDAYWQLADKPTGDVAQLRRALEPIRDDLGRFAQRTGKQILLTEIGFASQVGAATAPWSDDLSRRPAQDEQAAAYQAVLDTFPGAGWWAGLFFWTWTTAHSHALAVPSTLDHSARRKTAADVLRAAWATRTP